MNASRRVMIDRPFDQAVWVVIDSFVREGFVIKPADIRTPFRRTDRQSRRGILLKATYPDVISKRLRLDRDIAVLVEVDEIEDFQAVVTSSTVVTWSGRHPALVAISDRFQSHAEQALDAIPHRDLSNVVAA
jgi:hypothetical protein